MKKRMGIQFNKGFTLVEVLVSMVILAVGLLGIAGMQMKGLKTTGNANSITLDSYLAENLIERMRNNPQGVDGGGYNVSPVNGTVPTDPNCLPSCTSATLAQTDLYIWGQALSSDLPSGSGGVVPQGDGTFIVTVSWSDVTELGPNASVQPLSYIVRVRF